MDLVGSKDGIDLIRVMFAAREVSKPPGEVACLNGTQTSGKIQLKCLTDKLQGNGRTGESIRIGGQRCLVGGFQIFFIFKPIWGRFPF